MLSDDWKELRECAVLIRYPQRQVFIDSGNPDLDYPSLHHSILRIELQSGVQYAVDLDGAQFGFYEPVCPWEEYLSSRMAGVIEVGYLGMVEKRFARPDTATKFCSKENAKAIGSERFDLFKGWLKKKHLKILRS